MPKTATHWELKAGNIANLRRQRTSLPEPQANEVTVSIRAIGLNFADVFAIWGLYSATPKGIFTPGLEYAGVIEAVGNKVTSVQPGDRVMGITRFGAYTDTLNIDANYVIALPAEWTFDEGASYLVQALTAYYGLAKLGDLQYGQTVLIHSAAGGVGTYANRIAKKFDAFTIGTIGSSNKLAYLQREGYDAAIIRGADFAEQLREKLAGRELHVIMECIGGEIFRIGYEALAPMGRSVVYGSARYASRRDKPNMINLLWKYLRRPKIDPQKMIELNRAVLGFNLIYLYDRTALMYELLAEMQDLELGKPIVGHRFVFAELPEAVRTLQAGKTMGKVVVQIEPIT